MKPAIPFVKMHGAGNDFVVVFKQSLPTRFDLPSFARCVMHRQFGVGADQLLILSEIESGKVFQMDIYNADGSVAEMCGNGLRCVASYLQRQGLAPHGAFKIKTLSGLRDVKPQADGTAAVNMSRARFENSAKTVPIKIADVTLQGVVLSMGNPHFVAFGDGAVQKRIAELGPLVEHHPHFPNRTNVMLGRVVDSHTVQVAHWERGSGMTLACGSGACATAAAAFELGLAQSPVTIKMTGGDIKVERDPSGDLWMYGPVEEVYTGEYQYSEAAHG